MRKFVLFFLTSITSLWIVNLLLSGFQFGGGAATVFLVDLFVVLSIYLTEWVASKAGKSGMLVFILIGIFLTFFSYYFASLFLDKFDVVGGSLESLKIGFLKTPTMKRMDQILSLLIGSIITMLIAATTKWAVEGSSQKKE